MQKKKPQDAIFIKGFFCVSHKDAIAIKLCFVIWNYFLSFYENEKKKIEIVLRI